MGSVSHSVAGRRLSAGIIVLLMLMVSFTHIKFTHFEDTYSILETNQQPWDDQEQPWSQYGGTATRNGSMPDHSSSSGNMLSIDDPVINWVALDDGIGSDAYGSIIGNFSESLSVSPGAVERCTPSGLFAVILHDSTSTSSTKLSLTAGDNAATAWRVDLGDTRAARSTPVLADVDLDGRMEIIVAYDTENSLTVEAWSPEISCDESGWQTGGHSNELMWSWTSTDYRIGITSPHFQTRQSNHLSVTQPLLADLELDGTPELVLTVVDTTTEDPHIISLPLGSNSPTENWDVTLDRGTHPSDPVWAQLDGQNSVVVATTIDENSGNMWVWRLDGSTGSNDWGRVSLSGTDTDSDAPRLRLPSPVIVQLDTDDAPEMILTVPTDANGRTVGLGARFIGMELTSTEEIFSFRTINGYADAPPLPIDLDMDGVHDRLCWTTWYSASSVTFDREGMVGCHNLDNDPPTEEWSKVMNRGASGNDNDEIAVSPPAWMDIDGEGDPEIVVAFGKRIFAFEGDTGYANEISEGWDDPLSMPHRVWSAPAFADMDGDGYLDILYGDTLVSQRLLDLAPLPDNNGISFNPASPDPGQTLTVTGQFANVGTWENEDSIDCALYMDGQEITRVRIDDLEPLSPTGEGGPATFSVDVIATLGTHSFEMVLDVNQNLTETREDNNIEYASLTVVEPYSVLIQGPELISRIEPGASDTVDVTITAIGSRTANWNISYDTSNLPEDWVVEPEVGANLEDVELVPSTPVEISFIASLPSDALGDEDGYIEVTATLVNDETVQTTSWIPIEALRTRGLSLVGPDGLSSSQGYGIPGYNAEAYVLIENLGNAVETTTSIDWTNPSWGGTPVLYDGSSNVYSITLQPGEMKELTILLDVPSSKSLGSITSTTLTTCIGSGENTLCRSLDANFTAVGAHTSPTHIRTVPATNHQFEFKMELPQSGTLSWDLNQANIALPNWQWNATSGGTIQNGILTATGTPNSAHTVGLEAYIPPNAPPQRLSFTTQEVNSIPQHDFDMSIHVLQIHRASLSVINPQPSLEPAGFNVSTTHQILIQLENPGNGEDTYEFEARVIPTAEISSQNVAFTYYNPQRTLGPLATTIMPLDIILSDTLPAAQPFTIEFEWASIINKSVVATTSLLIEAEQRHEWIIVPLGGNQQFVEPRSEHLLQFNITNTGNYIDEVQLIPTVSVASSENDSSVWQVHEPVHSSALDVNGSMTLSVVQSVPYAWKNAQATITYTIVSGGYELGEFEIDLIIQEYAEWGFNLANSDLEIMPGGDYIQVELEQRGNSPSIPFMTKFGQGWNISLPEGTLMEPGQVTTIDIFVETPAEAREGDVNLLEIRVSDATGQGMEVFEVPVRVIGASDYKLEGTTDWYVSSIGGYPLSWIENTGNDLPEIEIEVIDLPQGWVANLVSPVVLTPGEIQGLPISLIPPQDWNKESFEINLKITHSELGEEMKEFMVHSSNLSFNSTPVLWSRSGMQLSVDVINEGTTAIQEVSGTTSGSTYSFIISSGEEHLNLTNGQDKIQLVLIGKDSPRISASCSFINEAFNELGKTAISGDLLACEAQGDPQTNTRLSFVVTTSRGDSIPLQSGSFTIPANQTMFTNLSVQSWDPSPGRFTLFINGYDEYGNIISSISKDVVSRESGWNVGISSISAKGDINVALSRTNYAVLEGAVCMLVVESLESDYNAEVLIDFAGNQFSPNVRIDANGLTDKEQLKATIGCNSPFDIDDDVSDDSDSIIYEAEAESALSSTNLVWGGSVAILIVGLYLFIVQRKDNQIVRDIMKDENKKPGKSPQPEPQQKEPVQREVEVDDISLEQEIVNEVPLEQSLIEEIPHEEEESASGRLDSIRRELNPDEEVQEKSSIEERMSKFFQ